MELVAVAETGHYRYIFISCVHGKSFLRVRHERVRSRGPSGVYWFLACYDIALSGRYARGDGLKERPAERRKETTTIDAL